MKIVIISGSPRGNSITYRVALHLENILKQSTDHDVDIIDLREVEMPQLQKVFTPSSQLHRNTGKLQKKCLMRMPTF